MNQNEFYRATGLQDHKTMALTLLTILLCASAACTYTSAEAEENLVSHTDDSAPEATSLASIKKRLQQHVRNASEWVKNAIDTVTKAPRKTDIKWILNENTNTRAAALAKAHRLDIQNANIDHLKILSNKELLPILSKLTINQIENIISYSALTITKSTNVASQQEKLASLKQLLDQLTPEQATAILNSEDQTISDHVLTNPTLRATLEYKVMGRKSQYWIDYIKYKEKDNPAGVIKHLKKASQADFDNADLNSFTFLTPEELAVVGAKLSSEKMKAVLNSSNSSALLSSFDALYTALPHLTESERQAAIEQWRKNNKFSILKYIRLAIKHVRIVDKEDTSAASSVTDRAAQPAAAATMRSEN